MFIVALSRRFHSLAVYNSCKSNDVVPLTTMIIQCNANNLVVIIFLSTTIPAAVAVAEVAVVSSPMAFLPPPLNNKPFIHHDIIPNFFVSPITSFFVVDDQYVNKAQLPKYKLKQSRGKDVNISKEENIRTNISFPATTLLFLFDW